MKKIACILLSLLMLVSMTVLPSTADEPALCYVNLKSVDTDFWIASDGEGIVTVEYQGIEDLATRVEFTVQIQKKTLGLFWTDVSNRSWSRTAYGNQYTEEFIFSLSSKGTYRAVVNYTIYGFGGGPDEVEEIVVAVYN